MYDNLTYGTWLDSLYCITQLSMWTEVSHCQRSKVSARSVDFSHVQIVQNSHGEWPFTYSSSRSFSTSNISKMVQDMPITTFCSPTGSRIWSIKWCHFQLLWRTADPNFKATSLFTLNISETGQDRVIVTMEY